MKNKQYLQMRGILWLWLAASSAPCFATVYNITASPYNAVTNNTSAASSNVTAIKGAMDDAIANGGSVYVPAGIFYVNATISPTSFSGNCTIFGDGENGSIIRLTGTSSVDLLLFSTTSSSPRLNISDLTLTTDNSNSQTALSMVYSSGAPASTGLVAERLQVRTESGEWAKGIKLTYAKNSSIKNCHLSGRSLTTHTVAGGKAISIEGDSSGTNILGTWISFWNTGIEISATQAGSPSIICNRCMMVFVLKGVYATSSVGPFQFINGHIDTRGTTTSNYGMELDSSSGAIIRNNVFVCAADTIDDSTTYGVGRYHIVVFGSNVTIEGNDVNGEGSAGGVIVCYPSSGAVIKDNIFAGIAANRPLWIQSGVTSTTIDAAIFTGCALTLLDQGTGTAQTVVRNL